MKAWLEGSELDAFKATMYYISYSTVYSPLGWKNSVSVILVKKGKATKLNIYVLLN